MFGCMNSISRAAGVWRWLVSREGGDVDEKEKEDNR